MRSAWHALAAATLLLHAGIATSQLPSELKPGIGENRSSEVLFPPEDDAVAKIIAAIGKAKKEIAVQAYLFTSRKLANALLSAHRAGVLVEVIVDREQLEKGGTPSAAHLAAAGVPVYVDSEHAAAHNKLILIDTTTATPVVITGSYNFTHAAQTKNAENVLVIRGDRTLAAAYRRNWQNHRGHSARMQ